jgi:transposase
MKNSHWITEHEGQVVSCTIYNAEASNGHKLQPRLETRRFLIKDGRRVWLSVPPVAWMREENRD